MLARRWCLIRLPPTFTPVALPCRLCTIVTAKSQLFEAICPTPLSGVSVLKRVNQPPFPAVLTHRPIPSTFGRKYHGSFLRSTTSGTWFETLSVYFCRDLLAQSLTSASTIFFGVHRLSEDSAVALSAARPCQMSRAIFRQIVA